MIPISKFILKKCLRPIRYFNLNKFHWLTHADMEFELRLKGPFRVEISSNTTKIIVEDLEFRLRKKLALDIV